MNTADKVRENRLRRMANRQGYRLVKSRRRDFRAPDYGTYMVVNENNVLISPERLDIDQVEQWLTSWPHAEVTYTGYDGRRYGADGRVDRRAE